MSTASITNSFVPSIESVISLISPRLTCTSAQAVAQRSAVISKWRPWPTRVHAKPADKSFGEDVVAFSVVDEAERERFLRADMTAAQHAAVERRLSRRYGDHQPLAEPRLTMSVDASGFADVPDVWLLRFAFAIVRDAVQILVGDLELWMSLRDPSLPAAPTAYLCPYPSVKRTLPSCSSRRIVAVNLTRFARCLAPLSASICNETRRQSLRRPPVRRVFEIAMRERVSGSRGNTIAALGGVDA